VADLTKEIEILLSINDDGMDVSDTIDAINDELAGAEFDTDVNVDADISDAEDTIGELDAEDLELAVDADTSDAEDSIGELDAGDLELAVDADTTDAEDSIGALDADDVEVDVDADITEAQTVLDEMTGTEIEWQVQLDTAQIEADAAIAVAAIKAVGSAIEWNAKLNIAEVQANADKVVAIAGAMEAAFQSAGDVLSSGIFDQWGDARGIDKYKLEEWINKQVELQEEAMQITKELAQAEIDYMNAKTEALKRGDAMITIDGAGLQPHLEAFMWEVLAAIQVKANEEGMDMLLGT